jgi:hypothetical protein
VILTIELSLLFAGLLGLGVWGVVSGVRASRRQRATGVSSQQLSGLDQPFRGLLGEALEVQRDVSERVSEAPAPIRPELSELARRIAGLNERAYPRALHGTRLASYLLSLAPDEAQYARTLEASAQVESELQSFLGTLRELRGKVYQVLTDATALADDGRLTVDLHDALIDVEALEEAFREGREGS